MKNKQSRSHLVLCLGRSGFGEAALGVRLASELMARGHEVYFIAVDSQFSLLHGSEPDFSLTEETLPLLPLYIDEIMKAHDISSVILSDYSTTVLAFQSAGLSPTVLSSYGIPIFAIDTWESISSPPAIDIFRGESLPVFLWPNIVTEICPVPFLAPLSSSHTYVSLPEAVYLSSLQRRSIRLDLGISEDVKAVLFCTAKWQQSGFWPRNRKPLCDLLPSLIGKYIWRLGPSVHLVHVGSCSLGLESQLGDRYHWVGPLARQDFDKLVAAMDMHITANISAMTIAKAMRSGVPSVVIQNSVRADTLETAESAFGKSFSPFMTECVPRLLPLYPFSVWPVGYFDYMKQVINGNPYVEALDLVELLDDERTEHLISSLLFNTTLREEHLARQSNYLNQVSRLPSGPDLIDSLMQVAQ